MTGDDGLSAGDYRLRKALDQLDCAERALEKGDSESAKRYVRLAKSKISEVADGE